MRTMSAAGRRPAVQRACERLVVPLDGGEAVTYFFGQSGFPAGQVLLSFRLVERQERFDHLRICGWCLEDLDRRAEKLELVSEIQKRHHPLARTEIMNRDVCQRLDDALEEGPVSD